MAISLTYIDLQRQIADELGDRTDLLTALSDSNLSLSPVQNAIQSAVSKWEREPFYFNDKYDTAAFNTVAQQETYSSSDFAAISTLPEIDEVRITVSPNRYTLNKRTWEYLEDIAVSSTSYGLPIDWAYYAEKIRFYPIPDAAYSVTLMRLQRFTALSANTDANVWTQDAYDLIRSEAKLILAREVINDPAMAQAMVRAIYGDPEVPGSRGYLGALRAETSRREGRGRIRPTSF